MERIRFRCNVCGKVLKARPDIIGCKCKCTRCGTIATIPSASTVIRPRRGEPRGQTTAPSLNAGTEDGEEFHGLIEDEVVRFEDELPPANKPKPPTRPPGYREPGRECAANQTVSASSVRPTSPAEAVNSGHQEVPRHRGRSREDEDNDDFDPGRPVRRSRFLGLRTNWWAVRKGLHLVYLASCLGLAAAGVFMVGVIAAAFFGAVAGSVVVGGLFRDLSVIAARLSMLGSCVLNCIGCVYCLSAPEKHSARILALVNLCLYSGAIVLRILVTLAGFVGMQMGWAGVADPAAFLAIPGFVVWLFYLRALALNMKAAELVLFVRNFIIGYFCAGGVLVLLILATLIIAGLAVFNSASTAGNALNFFVGAGIAAAVVLIVTAIIAFGVYCWYLQTLVEVLAAVDDEIGYGTTREQRLWLKLALTDAGLFAVVVIVVFAALERAAKNSTPSGSPSTNLPPGFNFPLSRDNSLPGNQPDSPLSQPAPANPNPRTSGNPAVATNPAQPRQALPPTPR